MTLFKFMTLWNDYWFFRINVILTAVGIVYLFSR